MTRFIIFLLLFSTSCLSIKPTATKTKSSSMETFFVGDDGLQYFIKPMCFQTNTQNKCYLDITFRHKNKIKGDAIANISFQTDSPINTINQIKISNSLYEIVLDDIECMFVQNKKKQVVSRFTTKIQNTDISKLFENEDWMIHVSITNSNQIFKPIKKTQKTIKTINQTLFIN